MYEYVHLPDPAVRLGHNSSNAIPDRNFSLCLFYRTSPIESLILYAWRSGLLERGASKLQVHSAWH